MFNDILTGKASLEQKVVDPYREPSVPDETRTCKTCGQAFTAKVTSTGTQCSPCYLAGLEADQAANARAYAASAAVFERSQRDSRWTKWLLGTGLAVGMAFTRFAMKRQFREDMATARGDTSYVVPEYETTYVPATMQDSFGDRAERLASQMCECKDAECVDRIDREYRDWKQEKKATPSEESRSRAVAAIARYDECKAKLVP